MSATVQELNFYPIKSFRGLRTNELRLDKRGAVFDRHWLLVDEQGGFLTQRQLPQLAKIGLRMDEASLELSLQDHGNIDFGLEERTGPALDVTVWKFPMAAYEVSTEVSEWLSDFLKKPVRLVRMGEDAKREVPEVPERSLSFQDKLPLLVISKASLEQLELKAGVRLSMSRFRPNIVIGNVAPHEEDQWAGFKIGNIEFRALKPCTRCKITTVHPLTGDLGEEPLKTLATYRRIEKGITFGYYYAHLQDGTIKIGAPVSPH